MKTRDFKPLRFCLFLGCILAGMLIEAAAAEAKSKPSKKVEAAEKLFNSSEVPRIQIEISPEDIAKLEKYQWRFGPQGERETVKATVKEGKKVYKDVALHLKGAAGSFR